MHSSLLPELAATTPRLETRLGPLAWRSCGRGPTLVFFAGALANGDLWRDVVAVLEDRYRCITIDLPLGAHRWPLSAGADRSATSLARLLLDCLEVLDVDDATVVANDTAGGLLLLSLASGHPALARVGRLVLTNCDSYDQFPPDALRKPTALARSFPRLARALVRLQARSSTGRRRVISAVAASALDAERAASFFGPMRRDPRVAEDLVAAHARGVGVDIREYDMADHDTVVELLLRAWASVFASMEAVLGAELAARLHGDRRAHKRGL